LENTVISSDKSQRAIKAAKVIFLPELPEYPETSDEGVAYLINTEKMSLSQVEMLCENVSIIDFECIYNLLIIH